MDKLKLAEFTLNQIVNGRFHIGNDENGNVFGPPDAVMCRNLARETLKVIQAGAAVDGGSKGETESSNPPAQASKVEQVDWKAEFEALKAVWREHSTCLKCETCRLSDKEMELRERLRNGRQNGSNEAPTMAPAQDAAGTHGALTEALVATPGAGVAAIVRAVGGSPSDRREVAGQAASVTQTATQETECPTCKRFGTDSSIHVERGHLAACRFLNTGRGTWECAPGCVARPDTEEALESQAQEIDRLYKRVRELYEENRALKGAKNG